MNGLLVSFLVKGKLTPVENFYKVPGSEPLIIAPLTYTLNQGSCQFSVPARSLTKVQPQHGNATPSGKSSYLVLVTIEILS